MPGADKTRRRKGVRHDRGNPHRRAGHRRGQRRRAKGPARGPHPGRHPRRPRRHRPPVRDHLAGHARRLLVLGGQAGRLEHDHPDDGRSAVDPHRRRDRGHRDPPARPWRLVPLAAVARDRAPVLGRHGARRDARRQAREPDGRPRGHAVAGGSHLAGRVRGHHLGAQRHQQHRDRGQVPHRRLRGFRGGEHGHAGGRGGRQPDRRRAHRDRLGSDRRGAGQPAAGLARHPLEGRPDHRRHRHQHRRARDHQLPVPARPVQEHPVQHPTDRRVDQVPRPLGVPGVRPDPVLGHARTCTSRCS